MALAAGTILGQYEIRSPLGAGAMGEVYRAHDTLLDREVAIKVLPDFVFTNPDRLARFEQEAKAAAALNHPNIVAVYQFGAYKDSPYLVTELLEGETLRDRLRHGPLPLRKTVDYGIQIADGLAAAHKKGIVHRDLKPENLFLVKDGRVKILDFGVAKILQSDDEDAPGVDSAHLPTLGTKPGVVLGTWGYMSPEQVRGQVVDQRSDIFALGAILHEMVTGKHTFGRPTSADTISAILHDEPPAISLTVPRMPLGLQRVIDRCLEKNADQRFQSASDLAFALEALSDTALTSTPRRVHAKAQRARKLTALVAAAVAVLAAVFTLGYWLARPASGPKASNYVQLTHDGQPKGLIGTNGSRLYLGLGTFPFQGGAEMSTSGGEPRKLAILPSANMIPLSMSPDGESLLVVDGHGMPPTGPLWSVPVVGGSPRRLGDIEGYDGAWSPNGKFLAYCNGSEVFVAKPDGTESRKLIALKDPFFIFAPVWSPDSTHLRFDGQEGLNGLTFLWEVSVDGTALHRVLPGLNSAPNSECCGKWTADGKYYVFVSRRQVWALREKNGFLNSEAPKPIQLTFSPLSLSTPQPSTDGQKLFVVGRTFRGELVRYDSKSGQFVPFLGGISAEYVAFSKDGQWVAYVAFPEGTLWRSKEDGSERLQLTYPPAYVVNPRWSPDGRRIVFYETFANKPSRIYEVSVEGGSPRQLMPDNPDPQADPNWSPDGSRIVFGGNSADPASSIRIVDLATHQISILPGSQGMFSPRWSPDGRYIPAVSADSKKLLLFDFQTQKWTELATGNMGWISWTKDGQYLQILDGTGTGTVFRIHLSDGKAERVLDLKNFTQTGNYGSWLAIAPDDSPLLLRNVGTQDVYSLNWEEP